MSEKAAEKKKEEPAKDEHGAEKKKGGGIGAMLTKLPVMMGGAMVVEALVLFIGFKIISGGPKPSQAAVSLEDPAAKTEAHGEAKAEAHGEAKEGAKSEGGEAKEGAAGPVDPKKPIEIPVVEFRAPNRQSGKTFLYDVSVYAVTRSANKSAVESAFKDNEALIKDRVRTIIAQSDPDKLGGGSEPGLETLRRQVKYQLDQIVGEGIVDEVLIPRCTPFRTDF